MELTFPFKNTAINHLLEFFEIEKIERFYQSKKNSTSWEADDFNFHVNFYKDRIPDFENELLQTINTTGQETIDHYFEELGNEYIYIKDLLKKETIIQKIEDWNNKQAEKFNEQVKVKEDEFKKHPDRNRKHLESWEKESSFMPVFGPNAGKRKYTHTNYNYYCIEDKLDYIDPTVVDEYFALLNELANLFFETSRKYGVPWKDGKIKSKVEKAVFSKPVVFVEGDHDISYITRAAELLNKADYLNKIELRQRGGYPNLNKIWDVYKDNNWDTIPQKKLLLYDCDVKKIDDEVGLVFKRIIPSIKENIISKGIENLFPTPLIEKAIEHKKAFIDITKTSRIKRGEQFEETVYVVNDDEKKNLCHWICQNGTAEDFKNFEIVFKLIDGVV